MVDTVNNEKQGGDGTDVVDNTEKLTEKENGFYQAAKSEKEKRQQLQQENDLLRQQAQVVQANQPPAKPEQDAVMRASSALGLELEPDDVPTMRQMGQINAYLHKEREQRDRSAQAQQSFNQSVDAEEYIKVVGSGSGATYVPSKYLTEALKRNPALKHQLTGPYAAQNAFNAAKIIEMEEQLGEKKLDEHQTDLEETIEKKTRPGSASSVGGSGKLNRGSHINSMSDEEFAVFDSQVAAGQYG